MIRPLLESDDFEDVVEALDVVEVMPAVEAVLVPDDELVAANAAPDAVHKHARLATVASGTDQ